MKKEGNKKMMDNVCEECKCVKGHLSSCKHFVGRSVEEILVKEKLAAELASKLITERTFVKKDLEQTCSTFSQE